MDASKLMALMADKKSAMARRDRTVKPRNGKNRIVLLPGWAEGQEHVWFHDYGQHFIKNAAGDILAVYPCSDAIYGTPCKVCAAIQEGVRTAPDDATIAALDEAKSSRRVLLNVLDLDGDKPNEPVIYEVPPTVFGNLVEIVSEWGIDAFKREIVINREGKGKMTKYNAQISPKSFEVTPAILSGLHNLDEYVQQESNDQLTRAINGLAALSGSLPAPSSSAGAIGHSRSAIDGEASSVARSEASMGDFGGSDLDDLLSELPDSE